MGQKVNPHGMRLGIIKNWNSIWYSNKREFAFNLNNDFKIRRFLKDKFKKSLISHILIERLVDNVFVTIYTARPGIIIGKNGDDIDELRQSLFDISGVPVELNIVEIYNFELDSKLIADNISLQLEHRVSFRRLIKRSVQNAIRFGVKGIKVEISGRLGGAEIARTEWYREGRVPLHTLRADIDFSKSKAYTTYGIIGVKVWVFKGEILDSFSNINKTKSEFVNESKVINIE